MKDKILGTLGIIIIVVAIFWICGSGVRGLFFADTHPLEEVFTNPIEGDAYEDGVFIATTEYGALKHTVNLIPTGTEHFYLIFSPDMQSAISIRAPKGFDKDFGESGTKAIEWKGRGLVKEMDHEVQGELSSYNSEFAAAGVQVNTSLYLDLTARKMCMMQICVGVFPLICVLYFVLLKVLPEEYRDPGSYYEEEYRRRNVFAAVIHHPVVKVIMIAFIFFTLGFIVHVCSMM